MDCILVVVFKNEAKANEGMKALLQLGQGSISINRYALVSKRADGTTTVEQANNPGSLGTLAGTSLGSLDGLLGVPSGLDLATARTGYRRSRRLEHHRGR
jgi:uncharacterized membrane protein